MEQTKMEQIALHRNHLLYRRQFILGPRYLKKFSRWKKKRINQNLFLMVHPDLELNYMSNNHISLILLGFILDPYNTRYSNKDILNKLIEDDNTFKEFVRSTYDLGGRWIIIYKDNKSIKIFHDATGDRQIYYSKNNSEIWCASQPHTIAKELNLKKSKDKDLNKFITSNVFNKNEHAWAGDGTLYNNIKHLLPNKYLDLKNGSCVRYWPDKKLKEISIKEAIDKSSEILKGLLKNANNRYNLMLAVTSGLDSRVLLAASKEIRKDVFYYIQKFGNLNYKSADIKIPLKLFPKLNLKFNVIECEKIIDNEFDSILKKNVSNKVTIVNKCVGDSNQQINFHEWEDGLQASTVCDKTYNDWGDSRKKTLRLPCITLKDYLDKLDIKHKKIVIKIDVQGYEEQVLRGLMDYKNIVHSMFLESSWLYPNTIETAFDMYKKCKRFEAVNSVQYGADLYIKF